MIQRILSFTKEYKSYLLYVTIVFLLWVFIGRNFLILVERSKEEVILSKPVLLDLSKDRDFLTCIYDQLICYDKNMGYSRSDIESWCGKISWCDSKK